jgi:hypothetical protein
MAISDLIASDLIASFPIGSEFFVGDLAHDRVLAIAISFF